MKKLNKLGVMVTTTLLAVSGAGITMYAMPTENGETNNFRNEQRVNVDCERIQDGQRIGQSLENRNSESQNRTMDGTGYGRGGEGKLNGIGGQGLHDQSCSETE